MRCPAEDTLLAFAGGRLELTKSAEVRAHVESCLDCAELLAALDASNPSPELGLERSDGGAELPDVLVQGDRISRYVVEAEVGQGGMGVVYSARDPELDRVLALKVLRRDTDLKAPGAEMRARLLREAKALARLQHPNVVRVHDVGRVGSRMFIVMEFVDGATLSMWMHSRPRQWREVLDVYLRAGRGLAAAHTAGLVHRDFKPANVLVGRDGRVCVTDFGLARLVRDATPPADDTPAADVEIDDLTRTGALMGSPAYMSPEQLFGKPADARSDQFSFCVALWAGLYGDRPFPAGSLRELRVSVAQQRFRVPDPSRDVPGSIRQILLRGLKMNPDERHPSMQALLSELERERALQGQARAERLLREAAAVSQASGGPRLVVNVALGLLEEAMRARRSDARVPVEPLPQGQEILTRVTMRGDYVAGMVRELAGFETLASHILASVGAGTLSADGKVQFDPDGWYPLLPLVRMTHRVAKDLGPRAAFSFGSATQRVIPIAPGAGLYEVLAAVDGQYRERILFDGKPLQPGKLLIGEWRAERAGDTSVLVHDTGGFHCDFDLGFITGLATRVRPDAIVEHVPGSCRREGGPKCIFSVRWGDAPVAHPQGKRTFTRAADLNDFLFNPFGRYIRGQSFVYWSRDPLLYGCTFFGPLTVEDVDMMGRAWAVLVRPDAVPHNALIDMALADLEPTVYAALAEALDKAKERFRFGVRQMAIVPPRSPHSRATVFDHVQHRGFPHPVNVFEDAREALEWLGRKDDGMLAELEALAK